MLEVNDHALSDVVLRQENIALRQQFKDQETTKCQLSVSIDELKLRNEALENYVKKLESDKSSLCFRLEVQSCTRTDFQPV